MGYAQELSRRMGGFQNFAISFSIICILAGGITAFPAALSAAGGASVGLGWPLACLFALVVATSLGQVASAYPTAGGIYHWASMLGGRGWGWSAAWFNLAGLLFVVSSVNFGVFLLFRDLLCATVLGLDMSAWTSAEMFDGGWWVQTIFIAAITAAQALFKPSGHPGYDGSDRLQRLSHLRRIDHPDARLAVLGAGHRHRPVVHVQ